MKKNIKNNLHYFKISQDNQEKALDDFYIFDEKHPELQKYIDATKEIKNILITIKILQKKYENEEVIKKYFVELLKVLKKFSNCSEFACFISACDNTLDEVQKNLKLLKDITKRYFSKRSLNEVVPEEWIQAILDSNASRKKGKCGELKLISILKKFGFKEGKNWDDFRKYNKCVLQFSKDFDLKNVRKNLDIKIRTKKQGKKLDLIIKFKERIFIVEAKHLNISGGAQDKQISELIEVLSLKEAKNNISYVSFLDGSYSNIILGDGKCGKKVKTQRGEIEKYLKKNLNNYWLNTAGFKELFKNFK